MNGTASPRGTNRQPPGRCRPGAAAPVARLVGAAALLAVACLALSPEAGAQNAAPTAADNTVTTEEDTPYTFAAADFNFSDTDAGDTLASVKIVTLPGRGSLTNDGTAVTANQAITKADIDAGKLIFAPEANAAASAYAGFTFKVSDGTDDSALAYTMVVSVTRVNDPPTAANQIFSMVEDSSRIFSTVDFGYFDVDPGDALEGVRIVAPPSRGSLTNDGTAVTAGQLIPVADIRGSKLVFTPAPNDTGSPYTSFTFRVSDGTAESATTYRATFHVLGVPDQPTAADNTVATAEDTPYSFAVADFNFSDPDPGDTLATVRFATLPAAGSLTNDGAAVSVGQRIPRADIDAGKLLFTPAADAFGDPYASFTFRVQDGSTSSASAYTMTVDVTPVNDPPTGANQFFVMGEDMFRIFSPGEFGFADVDPGDTLQSVTIVTPPGRGSLTVSGTPVTAGQSIPIGNILALQMVFAPAANDFASPYTSFTFKVSDGSAESAATYTVHFTVHGLNDRPTAADNAVATAEDTHYSFAVADFNFSDVDVGHTLATVTIVTLPAAGSLTNNSAPVSVGQRIPDTDIQAGNLVFTPAGNAFGDPYASFTFRVSDGDEQSASAYTMTVRVTAVNDPPTAAGQIFFTSEDTSRIFSPDDFDFADVDPGDTLRSVRIVTLPTRGSLTNDGTAVTAGQSIPVADILGSKLVFTPLANEAHTPYASFTFKVSDGTAESAAAYTGRVDVFSVPDQPTAADNAVATAEDTPYTFAAADFNFADVDPGDTLASVTIVTPPAAGALANDGTAVTAGQSIAKADIDGGKLVFTPAANAFGDPYASFTFKVSDGTAESAAAYTMTVAVTAVNDPPTAADNTVATPKDTPYVFAAGAFRFADVDPGDALASVTIATLPAAGSLTNDGTAVTANQSITVADIDANKLVFTPAANAIGDPYASFTFKVSDGTADSASAYTMTIDVRDANAAPTAANGGATTAEDTPYAFSAADFGFADADMGDTLASVRIVTLPGAGSLTNDGAPVTPGQSIARADIDAGKLVFAPAANAFGDPYASFFFRVSDGTDDSASAYSIAVTVTPVPDPPTAADNTIATAEDTPYAFSAADFGFADADPGDALASVTIATLPAAGSLTNDGTAVTAGQSIARADIDAGKLVFAPAAGAFGEPYASFTFKVSDGTAESASAYTMTVDVTDMPVVPVVPVVPDANAAPTAANRGATTPEDTPYAFAAADFGFADADPGDTLASVRIVTLPAAGSLTDGGAAVTAGQSIARADIDAGRLVFAPAANAFGDPYASFTFRVSDGTDESASAYTMTVDVIAVNDPPAAADSTVVTPENTPYAFAADDFNFSDPEAGDALASVRIVTLPAAGSLTDGGTPVTAGQSIARAGIDAGRLVFAPAANGTGDPYASFTFRVSDGTDESASAYTMTIDVTPSVETAMIEAWNVRLGRAIGVQAVDAVTSRFEAAGGSQVTLGGRRVGGTGPGVAGEEAGFADRPGWLEEAENAAGPRATHGMSGRELLRQSAFHLTGGGAGERPAYTVWGRMAFGAFEARVDDTTLQSDVTTGFIGVDGKWGRVLAGVAVALSDSEGSYRPVASRSGGFDRGGIQADLTGVYPYARFALAEDLSVWGLVGYGAGDLTVKPEGQPSILTRVAMRMGALGVKGRIFEGEEPDDLRLSLKSDAMWVQTESGQERDLEQAVGSANRLRLILDAEGDFGAAAGTTVTPSGEIGLRFDEGDAGTGVGMELGAGMRYAAGAFTVEGRVRALVAHEAKGRKEWGVSGSAALSPGALGRGPWFALQPVWGEAESGTETLWSLDDASRGGSERAFEAKGRLDARMGYGFEVLADRLTATPELGLRLAESYRRYSFGWRLERARPARVAFGLLIEATRREAAGGDRPPEHGVGVRLTAGW